MRIVYFGTPAFAVPTLAALLESVHEVVVVVTQPDRPRGRGQRVSAGPVKAVALEHGLPVLQPDRLTREPWEALLAAYGAELGVVAAYGKILPEWLLGLPARGLVNVHASLLPHYRGAAPIHRAVMNGDLETGVTIMRVVKALDAGPLLASVSVPIGPDDRTGEIEGVLAEAGARLLVGTVDRMEFGDVPEIPQDDTAATYAPRIRKEEGLVDWSRSAQAIHNQVRGLHPWPHAFTFGPSGRLIVHRTAVRSDAGSVAEPGTVVPASAADGLTIAAGQGLVEILEVQPEGGRVLSAREYLAGHPMPSGTHLGAP